MFKKVLRISPLLTLLLSQSHAATVTTSFSVLASVNNNCSVAANNVNTPYNPTNPAQFAGTNTTTVECTLGTPFHIRINRGLHGPDVTHRQASNGTQTLNYAIFRDAALTLNWGQTDGVDTVDSIGTGVAQAFLGYGVVPPLQNVPPGIYTDSLIVTVSF